MVELSTLALKTLRQLMEDPKASPSVRLKAALAALNRKNWALPAKFERKVDNQITQQIDDLEKEMAEDLFPMPETTPRNAVCPCGSGQKYKRCCGVAAPPHLARQAA